MQRRATHLDLFSGIGGFAIAAQNCGYQTVAFCEKEKYAQQILKERFGAVLENALRDRRDERWAEREGQRGRTSPFSASSPVIHPDIFTLNGADYAGVDLLTGGFPCQPFSVAGKRKGKADERAIWPEMLRVIDEARPTWIIGENVAGIVTMELDNILSDLEGLGYSAWPLVIPACAVDARHRRDRVWIVAHANHDRPPNQFGAGIIGKSEKSATGRDGRNVPHADNTGLEGSIQRGIARKETEMVTPRCGQDVADTTSERRQGQGSRGERSRPSENREGQASDAQSVGQHCEWLPEPELGRVAHGIPHRAHRLRGLGNAIVPQVAEEIIRAIANLR